MSNFSQDIKDSPKTMKELSKLVRRFEKDSSRLFVTNNVSSKLALALRLGAICTLTNDITEFASWAYNTEFDESLKMMLGWIKESIELSRRTQQQGD